jgi:cobaltochelatase CobN
MQTRYLHPQWISAQQAEGYSGTLQVLKTAQFLWGWQVTSPGTVRQDHWQALHDVYVRDQYRLGTRAWLEGSNQAAFAQTLERMLDAVRLKYWQPDAATRRELAQVYREALKATGLRESNAQVRRFAAELLPDRAPASASSANPVEANAAATSLTPAPVRGIRLEPQTVTKTPSPVVNTLATLWLTVLCLAWGGWRQWRRLPSLSSGVGA